MSNARHLRGSAWLNFQRVSCEQWSHHNGRSHVVLMGDAAHTAHFAIGSGTKLALEDAIELRAVQGAGRRAGADPRPCCRATRTCARRGAAAAERGVERDGVVRGLRRALLRPARARAVHVLDAHAQPAHQPREPAPARQAAGSRASSAGSPAQPACRARRDARGRRRCSRRSRVRGMTLKNRVVVSPMAQYSCVDGDARRLPPGAPRRARAWAAPAWS